jgi:AraC-like DNA-binding protein
MTEPIAVLELLARGGAVSVLLALALSLARDWRSPAHATGSLFCLGAAGHTITQSPVITTAIGPAAIAAWFFSATAGGLFWAFTLVLFRDRRRLSPILFAPAGLLLAVSLLAAFSPHPWARGFLLAQNFINAALMLHVLVAVWRGFRNDLVERRRRLRGPVIAAVALYALAVSWVQSGELFSGPATQLSALASGLIVVMSIAGAVVFQRTDDRLFGAAAGENGAAGVSVRDRATLDRLRELLDRDEVWRQEAISIGALAALVGAPEHRLRKIINEGLGYRNFAAFLNAHRIAAAKAALADPAQARTSVSSIAFDVGFSSLAPFNRAFREQTGQTPSQWRQATLAASSKMNSPRRN